jgi:hypothetical protein
MALYIALLFLWLVFPFLTRNRLTPYVPLSMLARGYNNVRARQELLFL